MKKKEKIQQNKIISDFKTAKNFMTNEKSKQNKREMKTQVSLTLKKT